MKMTKKKALLSIGFVTLLIVGISTAFAFGGHHHNPEKRANHMVEKVTKKLSLTSEQQDKLVTLKDAVLELRSTMHHNKLTLGHDVSSYISGETLDQDAILSLIEQKTEAIRTEAPLLVGAFAEFYNSLDVNQQEKMRTKINKVMRHIKDHHDED